MHFVQCSSWTKLGCRLIVIIWILAMDITNCQTTSKQRINLGLISYLKGFGGCSDISTSYHIFQNLKESSIIKKYYDIDKSSTTMFNIKHDLSMKNVTDFLCSEVIGNTTNTLLYIATEHASPAFTNYLINSVNSLGLPMLVWIKHDFPEIAHVS